MSRTIDNINTASDTFQIWIDKTNDVINAISFEAVTVNTGSVSVTTGNGYVNGIFGANTLVLTNLRGGNIASNSDISIQSNISLGNNTISYGTSNIVLLTSDTVTTTGTSSQLIDSFTLNTYRTGSYTLSVKNNVANGYQCSELMLIHNGSNVFTTEYSVLQTNGSIGIFSANANTSHARLYFTPIPANTTINYNKKLLAV